MAAPNPHGTPHPEVSAIDAMRQAATLITDSPDWQPFPIDIMPRIPREYVLSVAEGLGVDPAMVAVPMISVLGGISGTKVRLNMDPKAAKPWIVRTIFWTATVANSGSTKTPAWEAADDLAQVVEKDLRHQNAEAKQRFERELQEWKDEDAGDRGPKPKEPPQKRLVVDDATVEGIGLLLDANPSGLLLSTDELRNWVDTFARYRKSGGGSDASRWLPFHSGKRFVVDRKGGDRNSIYIPHAAVSVTGTIQPGILGRIIGDEERESGFFARMLLSMPPARIRAWKPTEPNTDASATRGIAEELARKLHVRGDQEVTLEPDAVQAFMAWQHAWAFASFIEPNQDVVAFRTKLEEYALRFSLLYFVIDNAWENRLPEKMAANYIKAGIATAEWFHSESLRVCSSLVKAGEHTQALRDLLTWIQDKCRPGSPMDGGFTVRDLIRSKLAKDGVDAALLVEQMLEANLIRELPKQEGAKGRPTKKFLPNLRQNDKTHPSDTST